MGDLDLLYNTLYRQARGAIRQLADPSDAPLACFALKHVFKEASKIDVAKEPERVREALQGLQTLLRGVQERFCVREGEDQEQLEAAREVTSDVLNHVLTELQRLGTQIIGEAYTFDDDIMRQESRALLDCKLCGGKVQPGEDLTVPWRGARCSLKPGDSKFEKCRKKESSRRQEIMKCGAVAHDWDHGFGVSEPDMAKKTKCALQVRRKYGF
jgi:hypothetical protein